MNKNMIGANYDGIQHPLPYLEHRGPYVDVAGVIAAQDKARAKEWRPDFSGHSRFSYMMLLALLTGVTLPACVPGTVLNPDLPTPDGHPTIGPATPDSAPTLVVTPGAPATEAVVNMPIANFGEQAPPDYIVGGIENMGLPTGSEATAWDGGLFKSVTLHGLVPVLDGGVAVNYIGADGLSYAPGLDELGDPSFTILRPNGVVDRNGIREYVSSDGSIARYVRAGLQCPDGSVCMQVVSYNPEDASVLYWVRVDEQTGEILGYLPAVSDERPTSGAQFISAEGKWESKPLTGSTALSVGEAVGVSYENEVNGEPIFIFTVGEDVVQANDDEIFYSPASETLWVQSDEGLFVSDSETGNWAQAKEVPGEAKIYEVEGKEFVFSLGQLLWVNEIAAGADVPSLTTTDGRMLSWINGEWEVATGYLSALELKQTDLLELPKLNGATLPGGMEFFQDVSVSSNTPRVSTPDNEAGDQLQTKLAFRAILRMIYPDLPDNDASLDELTKKIASGDCGDLVRTADLYTTTSEGRQSVKFMPYCGEDYDYPEGVTPIRGVNFVFGKYHEIDPSTGYGIELSEFPWFHKVLPLGQGAGLLIDPETGAMSLFVDTGFMQASNVDPRNYVATAVETAMDWLSREIKGTGDRYKLKSFEAQYQRALKWLNDMVVE